ncbi:MULTISPECIES: Ig-like domain-containing protein [unclassified Kitasatospora]|uniref:L,D-transpeptidase n=1 Tax=unclassified Kitasatospora TaxID=2633591 RepID=UPI0007C6A9C7|nr:MULTISPECIES: Ig-like domain-containing protein [unclassified Kitasatospora]
MKRLGRALTSGALGGVLALTAACSGGGAPKAGQAVSASPSASKTSSAVISIEPGNGSTGVKPAGALKVSVQGGKLTEVQVAAKGGAAVPGTFTADGSGWTPTGNLAVSTEYQVNAHAVDANGVAAALQGGFSTLTPAKGAGPVDNIADGQTYGVGMIVSLEFKVPVKDRAAVEQAVAVETGDGTVVKPHWFSAQRVDFRPEKYWKPQSKVTVKYRLKSVETSPGVYGEVDKEQTFTVGRSRISTADASSKQMLVQEDGKPDETVPISAGASSPASQNTFNGTMVVMAKEGTAVMDSSTVANHEGADYRVEMPHALRLTPTGTYVHGKNAAPSIFGRQNISHGCIGLLDGAGDGRSDLPGGKFYDAAMVGDVVTVKNSVGQQVDAANGMSGWNIEWSKW